MISSEKTDNNDLTTPLINFVHANGFPAGAYKTLFEYLSDDYLITALEKHGHNQSFPIHNNWQYLVDELIHHLKQQNQPVIGIGHSFGAVISFIAACQEPTLFKGLIMLDPPAMTGILGLAVSVMKQTPYIEKFTPAAQARTRRKHWPVGTDFVSLYQNRQLFKHFDRRCLQDYINSAMPIKNNRYELFFDADKEAEIFRTIPTNLAKLKNKLQVPAALIYGEDTDIFPSYFFKKFANQNKRIVLSKTQGGHMFPLEFPEETSAKIKGIIKSW